MAATVVTSNPPALQVHLSPWRHRSSAGSMALPAHLPPLLKREHMVRQQPWEESPPVSPNGLLFGIQCHRSPATSQRSGWLADPLRKLVGNKSHFLDTLNLFLKHRTRLGFSLKTTCKSSAPLWINPWQIPYQRDTALATCEAVYKQALLYSDANRHLRWLRHLRTVGSVTGPYFFAIIANWLSAGESVTGPCFWPSGCNLQVSLGGYFYHPPFGPSGGVLTL